MFTATKEINRMAWTSYNENPNIDSSDEHIYTEGFVKGYLHRANEIQITEGKEPTLAVYIEAGMSDEEKQAEFMKAISHLSDLVNDKCAHIVDQQNLIDKFMGCKNWGEVEKVKKENCKHKHVDLSDGLSECLDCGVRNY